MVYVLGLGPKTLSVSLILLDDDDDGLFLIPYFLDRYEYFNY